MAGAGWNVFDCVSVTIYRKSINWNGRGEWNYHCDNYLVSWVWTSDVAVTPPSSQLCVNFVCMESVLERSEVRIYSCNRSGSTSCHEQTSWNRVRVEKPIVAQLKIFPACLKPEVFIIVFTTARHLSLFRNNVSFNFKSITTATGFI